MIEPSLIRIPSSHPEFARLPEEFSERAEPSSSTSEDLSSSTPPSLHSSPVDATDSFPEEIVSSSLRSSSPSLTPVTVSDTALHRRLAAVVQRMITRNHRTQQALTEKANFKKNYNSFVDQIGKDRASSPLYYQEGMRLLGDKLLSPVGKTEISKVDLITNPQAYFSKSDLKVLKALQSFLLNKIVTGPRNRPLHENDWWALERLPGITMDETTRNSLLNIAVDFEDVLTKNLPLHLLRYELKSADQTLAPTSKEPFYSVRKDYNDPAYKSRWETACDSEMFHSINETIEMIRNNQADLASLFRKWDLAYVRKQTLPTATKHDTTNHLANSGNVSGNAVVPEKSVQTKYQKEYRDLSALRQRLEKMHDDLFVLASRGLGKLVKKMHSPATS
ncbi:MAG: hypothetical protein C5B47_04820 [Verrucomicrobia bacterium]|nr:MAG: hypothetical protein C5B47_04820 [Verrucomicrobiota bacterium]